MMDRPANAPLTFELAREVCERTGSAAVLEGSIASLGSKYVLGLRARSCRAGDVLDDEQAQAGHREDVLDALSHMARKLRTRLGESLATVRQHSISLAEATTPSLDAWKAFSTGLHLHFFDRSSRHGSLAQARYRDRPQLCNSLCLAGARLRRNRGIGFGKGDHENSVAVAQSCHRSGEILY